MSTEKSSRWIVLDPHLYDPTKPVIDRGVAFSVFLSPYDMPDAVRGRYDQARKRFIIDFRYISDEETEPKKVDTNVVVQIGRQTKRLHQIEVDIHALGAKQVALILTNAIERTPHALGAFRIPAANFAVAKDAIRANQVELLSALAG
jgi:hypothetical protein